MSEKEEQSAHKRPSWDEYFLQMAELVGSRGTCDRGRAGAVIVKDKRIVSTGYAGAPVGQPHCDEAGHEMHTVTYEDGTQTRHCIRTSHAELNSIVNAARAGSAVQGGTLYCKFLPCYTCAKAIVNAGIIRVVSTRDYHATKESKELFKGANVEIVLVSTDIEPYADQ